MSDWIYLDYQATTPLDPRVQAAMAPYLTESFGNPHSNHAFGWEAADAVEKAASAVASLLGASPGEILFTSGATEANNLAIQGIARSEHRRGDHIVTSAIEHKCVLNTLLALCKQGFRVDVVPVGRNGVVDLEAVASKLGEDTALVSIMLANNEIGTVQPIAQIGNLCRERGIVFHTDAAQAVGKLPVDVNDLNVDLLSLSGHKLYGPKGIGALYVSRQSPTPIEPLIYGGFQQQGLRGGTVPTFLCVGLGEASKIAETAIETDREHCLALREAFLTVLRSRMPEIVVNGDLTHRLPGNLNIRFQGVDAESLLNALKGKIAASTGAACNAGLIEPSYVLLALGLSNEEANSSIRFGFGRESTMEEVHQAAARLAEKAITLRQSLEYL